MNPSQESSRDALAEIDELALSVRAALKQVGDSFSIQNEANESFNKALGECLTVMTALSKRVTDLEERVDLLQAAIV